MSVGNTDEMEAVRHLREEHDKWRARAAVAENAAQEARKLIEDNCIHCGCLNLAAGKKCIFEHDDKELSIDAESCNAARTWIASVASFTTSVEDTHRCSNECGFCNG